MNKVLTLITFIGLANFAHADARADYQRQELLEATQAQTKAMQEQAEALSSIAFQTQMNAIVGSCDGEVREVKQDFNNLHQSALRVKKERDICYDKLEKIEPDLVGLKTMLIVLLDHIDEEQKITGRHNTKYHRLRKALTEEK